MTTIRRSFRNKTSQPQYVVVGRAENRFQLDPGQELTLLYEMGGREFQELEAEFVSHGHHVEIVINAQENQLLVTNAAFSPCSWEPAP